MAHAEAKWEDVNKDIKITLNLKKLASGESIL